MDKKMNTMIAWSMASVLFLVAHAFAGGMGMQTTDISSQPAATLIGASVRDQMGRDLGHIEDVVTDEDGKVTYLILAQKEIDWGSLAPAFLSPSFDDSVRLIPIPVSAVSLHIEKTPAWAAGEMYWGSMERDYLNPSTQESKAHYVYTPESAARVEGENYWGYEQPINISPALSSSEAYYVYTPDSVAGGEGKYWGNLDVGSLSEANPDFALHPTYVEHVISISIDEKRLANAPSFSRDEWDRFARSEFQDRVHAYYEESERMMMP